MRKIWPLSRSARPKQFLSLTGKYSPFQEPLLRVKDAGRYAAPVVITNAEYRFIVGRFNQKISSLIITQTLMASRGGETPAAPPAEEQTPAFKAMVAELMKNAEAEVARTMPKKIPHQGTPLPPVKEDAGV